MAPGLLRVTSLDSETLPLIPGLAVPPVVCLGLARRDAGGFRFELVDRHHAPRRYRELLEAREPLVGLNLAFDNAAACAVDKTLIRPVFDHYERGLVRDVGVRQKLLDIATGDLAFSWDGDRWIKSKHGLAPLAKRLLGRDVSKGDDTWRLRYGELWDVPIDDWPEAARAYVLNDAQVPLEIFDAQPAEVPNEAFETHVAWALELMGVWGVRTDRFAVRDMRERLGREADALVDVLIAAGFFRERKRKRTGELYPLQKNMEVIKARVVAAYEALGLEVPRTEPSEKFPEGQVSTTAEALKDSRDPALALFDGKGNLIGGLAKLGQIEKLRTTYLPALEAGVDVPINPHWNAPLETLRTSCARPNLQNPPRKGGVRECVVPRPGFWYASADYDTAELRSLAQACLDLFGYSKLADFYRANPDGDPHLNLAAVMLGITYEQAVERYKAGDPQVENARQLAKIPNFGMPGGMGDEAVQAFAKQYGIALTLERVAEIRAAWLDFMPEMVDYFARARREVGRQGEATFFDPRTGHLRGGVGFCDWCNGWFQTRTAVGATRALIAVARECYVDESSPLFGSRPVLFLHDQIICEVPADPDLADRAARRLAEIMVEEMGKVQPDVPSRASALLMRRWYKGAKQAFDNAGRLAPWEPAPKKVNAGA